MDCYKKFTTLGKTHWKNLQEMTEALPSQPENKITRSFSKLDKINRVGIFPKTYILCEKIRKTALVNVKKYANCLNDDEMLRKLSNIDFIAKEIR